MKTTRIDEYICIDVDQIVIDEMRDIIDTECGSSFQEDIDDTARAQEAAKIILAYYSVP